MYNLICSAVGHIAIFFQSLETLSMKNSYIILFRMKQITIECHNVYLIPNYLNISSNIFSPSCSPHNASIFQLACMDDLSHAQTYDNKFNYIIELHKHIIYCLAPRDLKPWYPHHRQSSIHKSHFCENKIFHNFVIFSMT